MAGEIVIRYVKDQTGVTAKVYEPTSPYALRDGPIACTETPASSAIYIGDSSLIVPNDRIIGFHNTVELDSEVWMPNAVVVTEVSDPAPDGGSTTDMVFDIAKGILSDDEFDNHIVTIQDISGGDSANRRIVSYKIVDENRRVTVDFPFEFPLTAGDTVIIRAGTYDSFSGPSASEITTAVWLASRAANKAVGSMGQVPGLQNSEGA